MNDRKELVERLWKGRSSPIVQILGTSMTPSLEEGWRVRIDPATGEIVAGDIVQLDIGIRPVLHRAIHVFLRARVPFLFQRGDAGGPLTAVALSAVTGRAAAILSPEGQSFPTLDRLPRTIRRRFERTRRFARFSAWAWNATTNRKLRRFLDICVALYGRKLISTDTVVFFRRTLSEATRVSTRRERDVREIPREALTGLLEKNEFPPLDLADLDLAFGCPWKCFVAFSADKPVHHCFVALRPTGPHIFRAWTIPENRNQGFFTETVDVIAETLRTKGHIALTSYSMGHNPPSIAAHHAAGFRETRRRSAILLLGLRPRWILSRLIGLLRRHPGPDPH